MLIVVNPRPISADPRSPGAWWREHERLALGLAAWATALVCITVLAGSGSMVVLM